MKLQIAPESELITPAPSQFLSPKQPPTGDNRQITERQTEGHATADRPIKVQLSEIQTSPCSQLSDD